MATTRAVLGVIRASRPNLQSAMDRVAFAIHSAFLAVGYSIVAVGANANTSSNDGMEEHEVGFEGWNMLDGAYAFCYSGTGQFDLCKSVTLKLVIMADSLMVDVFPIDTKILHHLEIRANDFAKDGEVVGNYMQHFNNLDGLIKQVNEFLLAKLSPPSTVTCINATSTSSTSLQNDHVETRRASSPPLIYDTRRSISNPVYMFPPIFMGSNSDLFPRASGGIFAPRRDFSSDGMLIGPSDVRWRQLNGSLEQQFSEIEDPNTLPNARYDPIGPLDILDIDDRSTRRPPERHPDLEPF